MLGAILDQVVIELERVPEEISRVLQKQKKTLSGLKPRLDDIVKMLQLTTSLQRTFMVIGALDESTAVQRYRFFLFGRRNPAEVSGCPSIHDLGVLYHAGVETPHWTSDNSVSRPCQR